MEYRLTCVLLLVFGIFFGVPAEAQGVTPPPRSISMSASGVLFASGAFSLSNVDLSIGGPESEGGITLTREYMSNLNGRYSSGFRSQGWTHNLTATVSTQKAKTSRSFAAGREPYIYSVAIGEHSVPFTGGSFNPTGGVVGSYTPVFFQNDALNYTGTEQNGTFTYTKDDGSIYLITDSLVRSRILPNGISYTYNYDSNNILRSIFSNAGYAILFEGLTHWEKACVVNTSKIYVIPTSACPQGVQTVTYGYSVDGANLTSFTDAVGNTTFYDYTSAGTASHLSCVHLATENGCKVSNTYNVCRWDPAKGASPAELRLWDQVISQSLASGQKFNYSYGANPYCPLGEVNIRSVTTTSNAGDAMTVVSNDSGATTSVSDALNNVTTTTYPGVGAGFIMDSPFPSSVTFPEGNKVNLVYGHGASVTQRTKLAKAGAQLSDIVSTASYSACVSTNRKTCNKPDYIVDDRGNRHDFSYDPAHGGVLSEAGPADANGVQLVKRYAYSQHYAWISNGSGYVHAATPVWLRDTEKTCRTTVTSSDACAGGSADEVVTSYDYGPDTGAVGNNLLLRGVAVTADGHTRRTCYGYDAQGNRIWETKPRAGLAACS